ncbi:MAG TPA: DNA cytosine methyltransferase [Pyrinomonadaceae bacterium]|nr:DNA cytosine methyltransferase [Pyrinomonadaceae bacterium]
MPAETVTAISLFSGCGGFDWGVAQEGVHIVWANDIDEHAAAAYQALLPDVTFVLGDVRDISTFPRADLLIGCYPCTGLSLAARRRWRQNPMRDLDEVDGNFLYWSFLRALKQVLPKYFFVENVVGMMTANNGWFFDEQIRRFARVGYRVAYEILNAGEFGVAQSRKRVFIVGVRKDIRDFVYKFPVATHGPGRDSEYRVLRDAIGNVETYEDDSYYDGPFHGHYLTRNRKRSWDQLSYTIVANGHHVPLHPAGLAMRFVKKDTWKLQGRVNRRLSWRECAAIQGLPDHAVPSGGLFDKYRVIGNAVPPAFGQQLIRPIVKYESSL